MPLYDYNCDKHGHFEEIFFLHADSSHCVCPKCGKRCKKLFVAPAVHLFVPHFNEGLGEFVETKRQVNQICKQKNLTPVG